MPETTHSTAHVELRIRKMDSRHITAVVATDTPVDRAYGKEVLEISRSAIDLSRLPIPVLMQHNQEQMPIGIAQNARIRNGELLMDLMLADSPEADAVYKQIRDGIYQNLSIGYRIKQQSEPSDGVVRVTSWEPLEVSLVSIPADPNSRVIEVRKAFMNVTNEQRAEILALAKRHNQFDLAEDALSKGHSLQDFRSALLDRISDGPLNTIEVDDYLGMTKNEERQFSLAKAINAEANGDWSDAGFEREVLRETGKRAKHGGIVLPPHMMKRDFVTTSPANGSNLIQTDVLGGSFIDALFSRSIILDQVTTLTGNTGDIAIPKMATTTSAAWYTETGQINESTPTISQISLSPKSIAAFTEVSRRMIQQASNDVEALLRRDMANQIASAIDAAILEGGGSNEPTGVIQTGGIGSVALGTNGGAITYESLVDLVKEVSVDNALDGNLAYVTNPKVMAAMRQTPRQTGGVEGSFILGEQNSLHGYPVFSTNNCPSDLTKGTASGVCSAVVFGNWQDVIVAFWSNLEILVDPYTKANQQLISLRAVQDLDVAIRHPESFAAIVDVTTA